MKTSNKPFKVIYKIAYNSNSGNKRIIIGKNRFETLKQTESEFRECIKQIEVGTNMSEIEITYKNKNGNVFSVKMTE